MGELLPADYVLLGVSAVLALLGLFRGLSGTLGFFTAAAVSTIGSPLLWSLSERFTPSVWARALATGIAVLILFGLVRLIVKKCVNGLLAQPSDSLLGLLVGALFGVGFVIVWAISGVHLEYSVLAQKAAEFL